MAAAYGAYASEDTDEGSNITVTLDDTGHASFTSTDASTETISVYNGDPDAVSNLQSVDKIVLEGELAESTASGTINAVVGAADVSYLPGPRTWTAGATSDQAPLSTEALLSGIGNGPFVIYDTTPTERISGGNLDSSSYMLNLDYQDVGQNAVYFFLPETAEEGEFANVQEFETYLNSTLIDGNGNAVTDVQINASVNVSGDIVLAADGHGFGGMTLAR